MSNGTQQYIKLENRLVLLAWLNSLLGYPRNRDLLEDTKTVAEGFGADGRSFLYHHLIARGSQVNIPRGYSRNACLQKWRRSHGSADSSANGKDRGILSQMEGAAHVAVRFGAAR
jgi:hypothetical protein